VRGQPGSVLGIWAGRELAELLGQRVAISTTAQQLESLIERIPTHFDRYPDTPSLAVSFSAEPVTYSIGPYEPIVVNLHIVNNSTYPLALDPFGPIRPQVLVFFSSSLERLGARGGLDPVVIDIARRIRLRPHEELVVPVDLRRFQLGDFLATRASRGTFIKVRCMLNFRATRDNAIVPALLGAEQWTDTMRIEGVRINLPWIQSTATDLNDVTAPGTLVNMAMLGQMLAIPLSADAPPELFRIMDTARQDYVEAFAKLDDVGQAWLLTTVPAEGLAEAVRAQVHRRAGPLTTMCYMMFHLAGPEDPVFEAARRSDNERVRFFADQSSAMFATLVEMNRQRGERERAATSGGR
jgi:hypothetical protein